MSHLREELESGRFVVTAEVAPPKGIDISGPLALAHALPAVTAVNVTDNQGGNMRMSPLALAARFVSEGIEPVLQLTCRDRNRLALQADLLGASALGIENLLLLSGDHIRFGDHPGARSVFDLDSVHLLGAVHTLMSGRDMSGAPLDAAPRFFAGAAVTPEAEPFDLMFQKFTKKVQARAEFFQTQAVFDIARLERFMEAARPCGVPVLLGVLLVRSARMARFLNENIPGVRVPPEVIDRLEKADDPLVEGVSIAREMVSAARSLCQGVHLMTLGHDECIPEILSLK